MKINKTVYYLFLVFLIFVAVALIYYKNQVENFKELIIKSNDSVAVLSKNNLNGYIFNRICIGKTCIDGNVLASIIDMFRDNTSRIRTIASCSDNVCILPEHLKNFNNSKTDKPEIVDASVVTNENNIAPFSTKRSTDTSNDGFRMSLSDSTDTILNGFGTDIYKTVDVQTKTFPGFSGYQPFTTRMMSGRICYSPGERYQVQFNRDDLTSEVKISDFSYRKFLYFDYDEEINKSSETGILDYNNCYNDSEQGDYSYNPVKMTPIPGVTTNDKLKDLNMIATQDILKPLSRQTSSTLKFQMGKPYDSIDLLDPPSKNQMEVNLQLYNLDPSQVSDKSQVSGGSQLVGG